jgi:hypothetical protein
MEVGWLCIGQKSPGSIVRTLFVSLCSCTSTSATLEPSTTAVWQLNLAWRAVRCAQAAGRHVASRRSNTGAATGITDLKPQESRPATNGRVLELLTQRCERRSRGSLLKANTKFDQTSTSLSMLATFYFYRQKLCRNVRSLAAPKGIDLCR